MEENKIVFISFNQALESEVLRQIRRLGLRGYTSWEEISGAGSTTGVPHLGTHAWPTRNGAFLVHCSQEKAHRLMDLLQELDESNPLPGLRAFMWSAERTI